MATLQERLNAELIDEYRKTLDDFVGKEKLTKIEARGFDNLVGQIATDAFNKGFEYCVEVNTPPQEEESSAEVVGGEEACDDVC